MCSGMYASLSDEGTLQQLVDDTKIPDLVPQLQEFALRPIAKLLKIQDEQLASSSSMQSPQLLQLLRAVRNLSAVGEDMTQNLYSNGILAQIINLLKTIVDISPGSCTGHPIVVKLIIQALANMTTSSPSISTTVWEAMFPHLISSVIKILPDVQPIAAAIIFNCVRSNAAARQSMITPPGVSLLQKLLQLEAQGEYCDPRLQLLVGEIAVYCGQLLPLLEGLTSDAQAIALHLVYSHLEGMSGGLSMLATATSPLAIAMCRLFNQAATAAAAVVTRDAGIAAEASSEAEPAAAAPDPAVNILDRTLRVLIAITSVSASQGREDCLLDLIHHMFQEGLVDSLLAALRALPPITKPNRDATQKSQSATSGSEDSGKQMGAGADASEMQRELTFEGSMRPHWPDIALYTGYRTDLVAVLANLSFGQTAVQLHICSNGGVQLLLEQCQIDDDAPLVREHALWGIRNLCANPAAQEVIGDLQVLAPAQNELLTRAGYQIHLDSETNKPSAIRNQ